MWTVPNKNTNYTIIVTTDMSIENNIATFILYL